MKMQGCITQQSKKKNFFKVYMPKFLILIAFMLMLNACYNQPKGKHINLTGTKTDNKAPLNKDNKINLTSPKRSYKWGTKYWIPNGIDKFYRIENKYHGQAITALGGSFPVHTQQIRTQWPYNQDFIFEKATSEPGVYYIGNYDWQNKLHYLTSEGKIALNKTIEVKEIKVFSKNNELISKSATVTMSEAYNDKFKASNAIDGNLETVAITKNSPHPWIQLDFKKNQKIEKIEIFVRQWTDFNMRDATVTILNANKRKIWSKNLIGSRPIYRINLIGKNIEGKYLRIEHIPIQKKLAYVGSSPGKEGKAKQWRIELVDTRGFYKIVNVKTGLAIKAPILPGPDLRTETHAPLELTKFKQNDSSMQWNIEPLRNDIMDCLAVSQIGWTPQAMKIAILVRKNKLPENPEYFVTKNLNNNTGTLIKKGKAEYINSKFLLNYYKIDISDIKEPGDYFLDCDGDRVVLHIANDAYINIRHRGGNNTTHLWDIIGGKGFVGHWGRLTTWCKEGADSFESPYWMLTDPSTRALTPQQPLTKVPEKFVGGWDHTDRAYGALQPSAALLHSLVFAYRDNNLNKLKAPLVDEMEYGVKYFINTQSKAGTWPVHSHIANVYTGTVASVGTALAAAVKPLSKTNPTLSRQAKTAAEKAWTWVEANPDKWVPVNTTYRQGHSEEQVMFAVEMYLLTGEEKYKKVADTMISQSMIGKNGAWIKAGPGKFAGQTVDERMTYATLQTFMEYYPKASIEIKTIIDKEIDDYFNIIVDSQFRKGVFGVYDAEFNGYGNNSSWLTKATFMYKTYLFKNKNKSYKKGYFVAERIMDWLFGCNEFATSMVFGFGNIFAIPGWIRPYEIGSILPGITLKFDKGKCLKPSQLTSNSQTYGNMETEAEAGVRLIHAMLLRNILKDTDSSDYNKFLPELKNDSK